MLVVPLSNLRNLLESVCFSTSGAACEVGGEWDCLVAVVRGGRISIRLRVQACEGVLWRGFVWSDLLVL